MTCSAASSRLSGMSAPRVGLSVLLGALAVGFGVALMATAGYLISRAAEQPPILSLGVDDRARPLLRARRGRSLRYLDRLASHDLALRALGRIRDALLRADRAARARRARRLPARRAARADGRRRRRARRASTCAASGRRSSRSSSAAGCVARDGAAAPGGRARARRSGCSLGGVAVPRARACGSAAPPGARQSAARAELTAELVELLRGAPELVAYGREDETLARVRAADAELARLGRRDALVAGLADSLSALVAGLTAVGVLAVAVSAHDAGSLDRVLVASLALLALASFEAVAPLPAAARELSATLAAGRRVLELTDREPAVRDPAEPLPPPRRRARRARGRDRALRRRRRARARRRRASRSSRAAASRSSARAAPARRR